MYTLATKYRPTSLTDLLAQETLVAILQKMIEKNKPLSFILYGEPGCGKTTIAKIFAESLKIKYHLLNATNLTKKDIDTILAETKFYPQIIVIIDEIHRLNKDKQDLLLQQVEEGKIVLIGATTSNPLFSINPALRSRTHLFEVKKIDALTLKNKLITITQIEFPKLLIEEAVFEAIANHVNGDIRYALNILELLSIRFDSSVSLQDFHSLIAIPNLAIDKNGDNHYNLISAFQKSIRGSDVDAALYYLAALITSNDHDAIYRRLIVCAYEDIGLANPQLTQRVSHIIEQVQKIGLHEGRILLANAVIELCLSPKSKSSEQAIDNAFNKLNEIGLIIPDYLKLNPINIEEKYDYNNSSSWRYIQYLPDKIKNAQFYFPGNNQYENILKENYIKLKQNRTNNLSKIRR